MVFIKLKSNGFYIWKELLDLDRQQSDQFAWIIHCKFQIKNHLILIKQYFSSFIVNRIPLSLFEWCLYYKINLRDDLWTIKNYFLKWVIFNFYSFLNTVASIKISYELYLIKITTIIPFILPLTTRLCW